MKNLFTITVIIVFVTACNNRGIDITFTVNEAVRVDAQPGQCPYLTKDNKGNTVLSWVRMINDTTSEFCYATSKDGISFSQPVVIPNSGNIKPHGENLPKIIFKPSGELIALWGAANPNPRNKHSGQVFYTQSFDNGKTWNDPRPLVTDTASYDQRYYDVALMPNGEAGIIWLDNRKTIKREGSGLYFATTNGTGGFTNGRLISEQCCQCCRTDLYIDKMGGIHALYRGIIQDSIRDMVHTVSTDGGKTFTKPERISQDNWVLRGCPHTGPAMTENATGVHFAWFTGGSKRGCFYTKSDDNGASFKMQDSVSFSGSHPQITSLPDGELVIVWDEPGSEGDKVFKRIGIQRRDADGKNKGKTYITNTESFASYPVVSPLNGRFALVAYAKEQDGKLYVDYQRVGLK
ncbi:MAG TPA: sialidase family protein [Chitinophagaceae bacterium]